MTAFRALTAAAALFASSGALPLAAGALIAGPAAASQDQGVLRLDAWDSAAFEDAAAAGEPVAIVASKPGCPVCTVQIPAIEAALWADPTLGAVRIFQYDQTSEAGEDLNRRFGVTRQSTIVVFDGDREVARTVGMTDPGLIARELRKAF